MSKFLRWFLVGAALVLLSACGGGSSKTTAPKMVQVNNEDTTVSISEDTHEAILDTTPPENNTSTRFLKLSSDAASTIDADKKYIDIPAFTNERFPFGYIGKIVDKTENSDGSVSYKTEDLEANEAFNKIKFPEETLQMKDMVIADIIVPDGVIPLDASGKQMKKIGTTPMYSVKEYKEKVSLKYEVKFDNYTPSSSGNAGGYQKLSFIIDGVLKNLKITKEADAENAKSGAVKLIAEADLSASIKTEMLGSIVFGNYDKFWRDAEKKAVSKGLSIKGLKSIDKQGKIPLAGLVIYPSTVFPMTGSLPTTSIEYQPIGMLVWVYLDLKGTLTLHGSIGIEVNNHLKVGFEKKAGEEKSNFIGELSKIENKPLLKMPYIKGNAKLEANIGISLDVDLFAKGLRFATASSEIGANYVREIKVDKEIYYGAENSYSDPFAWHGGAVCWQGSAGVGVRQYAGIALGVEYKADKSDRPKWSIGFDGFWQYPNPKDIEKVTKGRVGNSLWWVLGDTRTCFNLKTMVSDIGKLTTHLERYRKSNMSIAELRDLSDKYYAHAYLSKRIYDESKKNEGEVEFGWKLEKLEYVQKSGFKAGLYKNTSTNKYAVVYGGTTATLPNLSASVKYYDTMVDLLADATLLANTSWKPKQAIAAIDFLNTSAVKSKIDNGEVSFIAGHSLGGGLAQLAGIYTGIDTVTINTAPMPLDETTVKILQDKGVVHIATQNTKGKVTSYSFDHPDILENIMMREDPISSISTAVMDLEGEDSFYTTVAKTIMNIDDVLTMDFLIEGTQTYLPFDSSNSSYTLGERHSSTTVLDIFKSNTNYKVESNVQVSGTIVSIDNVQVKDKNDNTISSANTLWGVLNADRSIDITRSVNDDISELPAGTYTLWVGVQLDDGRNVFQSQEIIIDAEITPEVTIELLNETECKTTKLCKFNVGVMSHGSPHSITMDYGDGNTEDTGEQIGEAPSSGPDTPAEDTYRYTQFDHTYIAEGEYTINVTVKIDGKEDVTSSLTVLINGQVVGIKLKKTGQTTSYYAGDDGDYQKGVTPNYSRSGEVVTDHITGLEWQDNLEVKTVTKNWTDVKAYCSALSLSGGGWRLPSIQELQSIVVDGAYNPSIDTTAFVNYTTSGCYYWSSTTHANSTSNAWIVDFYNGYTGYYTKSNTNSVRCVR